jgi:hypothetical protein
VAVDGARLLDEILGLIGWIGVNDDVGICVLEGAIGLIMGGEDDDVMTPGADDVTSPDDDVIAANDDGGGITGDGGTIAVDAATAACGFICETMGAKPGVGATGIDFGVL